MIYWPKAKAPEVQIPKSGEKEGAKEQGKTDGNTYEEKKIKGKTSQK